jgi:DNA polymerase III alpha subunit (gram-positive type)
MLNKDQIYIVVDIEGDGPVPGQFSMLSLGAVATTKDNEISSFYRRLQPLESASQDPRTMEWWKFHPEAWKEVTTDMQSPEQAMKEFKDWIISLEKQPVFVAQPTGYDYAYVSWYLWEFTNSNPFTDQDGASQTLDLASYISGKFNLEINKSTRRQLPDWMKEGMPEYVHNAVEDARGFSFILRNILNKTSM